METIYEHNSCSPMPTPSLSTAKKTANWTITSFSNFLLPKKNNDPELKVTEIGASPRHSLVRKLKNLSKFIELKTMSQLNSNRTSISSRSSPRLSIFDRSKDSDLPDHSGEARNFLSPGYQETSPSPAKGLRKCELRFFGANDELQRKLRCALPSNVELGKIQIRWLDSGLETDFYHTNFQNLISRLKKFCQEFGPVVEPKDRETHDYCIRFDTFREMISSSHKVELTAEGSPLIYSRDSNAAPSKKIFSFGNLNGSKSPFSSIIKENKRTKERQSVLHNVTLNRQSLCTPSDQEFVKSDFACNCYYSRYFTKGKFFR